MRCPCALLSTSLIRTHRDSEPTKVTYGINLPVIDRRAKQCLRTILGSAGISEDPDFVLIV